MAAGRPGELSPFVEAEWITVLQAWAEDEPLVEAVYLFGSRIRGDARPESDLDVAVQLRCQQEKIVLKWMRNSERWLAHLKERLPVEIHLKLYDPDNPSQTVVAAVKGHGVLIYPGCQSADWS
jgi:predicted nucleotidyltransferase